MFLMKKWKCESYREKYFLVLEFKGMSIFMVSLLNSKFFKGDIVFVLINILCLLFSRVVGI